MTTSDEKPVVVHLYGPWQATTLDFGLTVTGEMGCDDSTSPSGRW
jgi:hypothetical protein